jgi:hypothetical protein
MTATTPHFLVNLWPLGQRPMRDMEWFLVPLRPKIKRLGLSKLFVLMSLRHLRDFKSILVMA